MSRPGRFKVVPAMVIAILATAILAADATAKRDAAGLRMFTAAGGGASAPADGVAATDARLVVTQVAALDDGAIVLAHLGPKFEEYYRIDVDGRLQALPRPDPGANAAAGFADETSVSGLDTRADGTLVAAIRDRVWELPAGAPEWHPLPAFATGALRDLVIDQLAAAPGGMTFVAGDGRVWLLAADGHPVAPYQPPAGSDEYDIEGLVALPNGGFAFKWRSSEVVVRQENTGRPRRLHESLCCEGDLAALADGSLLRAATVVQSLPITGRARLIAGQNPGLGLGDGQPIARALVNAKLIDSRPDGTWLIADAAILDPFTDIDHLAWHDADGLWTMPDPRLANASLVRIASPGLPSLPVVAIEPRTYELLDHGRIAYASSFAGQATLSVRAGREIITTVTADVAAGEGELILPRALRAADYRLELRVVAGRRVAVHRLAVALTATLPRNRAVRLARKLADEQSAGGDGGGGGYRQAVGCRRETAKRFHCAAKDVVYGDPGDKVTCVGVYTVVLRRDGARAYLSGTRRACRRLMPRSADG